MRNNKNKKNVHMVQHTHWDREWYFTSDDSRMMLYYDLKYLIEYLEKNDDKFSLDGQSSVIEDFLMYSPDWKDRFAQVVKAGKLLVGPFYTQTDNVLPNGESISRNIEIGNKIAKDLGKSMQVGYLPDTFGHNNQSPQILKMNGIDNISFYRGLDPEDTDDQLYFNYVSPDGTSVLGHWQTHYSTKGEAFTYTTEDFDKHIVQDYTQPGQFHPSVIGHAKDHRSLGLPIAIPIGTDQRPFRSEVKQILEELNKKYEEFNFIASDYETALKEVVAQIKKENVQLKTVTCELRQALTGRVHRSVLSSRMDIKQLLFKLETLLVDVVEPLSIMCLLNDIDVPWKVIEHVWKELFKSSAHDSYGTTNEDHVNRKLKQRLINATRVANGLVAMLSRIYSSTIVNEKSDSRKKLVLFNFDYKPYTGLYQFETTIARKHENGSFSLKDGDNNIQFAILKRNNMGTHERDALTLLTYVSDVPAFGVKVFDIVYPENPETIKYVLSKSSKIGDDQISVDVKKDEIIFNIKGNIHKNILKVVADPSVGDTYDHSPITHNDKKYEFTNYEVLETNIENKTMKIKASCLIPSGIESWKTNSPSVVQDLTIQFTIFEDKLHAKLFVTNKALNARLSLIIETLSHSDEWIHDQQFGIYRRNITNKWMENWDKPNKLGYKWDEYPTNLSPHQSWISNNELDLTIYTSGTREHEMIKYEGKKYFSVTLYRAFGVFGTSRFLYRPGRGSGAKCDAPDCQLLGDLLEYDFIIDFNKTTEYEKFEIASNLHAKNYYIPDQWGLERTLLRWDTNISYYDGSRSNRRLNIPLPTEIVGKNFVKTAMYKTVNDDIVLRMLNLGEKVIVSGKVSRDFSFDNSSVEVPKYGLVNILIGCDKCK